MYFLEEASYCKIQSPKKTTTCLKSTQLGILHKSAIRLPFPVYPVFQANLQLVPARNLNIVLFLLGSDLIVKSTESEDAQTTKPSTASTSTAQKIQVESSAHEGSSSSDQEQDPEVFIQPSKTQLLPNILYALH